MYETWFIVIILALVPAVCVHSQTLSDDPNLKRPAALAVKGESLADIMGMLEKQTGVRLRAATEVADQKATIFVDDKPLSEVMSGLSTLFKYRWKLRTSDDRETYELYADPKLREPDAYQEALAKALGELDAAMRSRKDAWGRIYCSMSSEQLEGFRAGMEVARGCRRGASRILHQ